MCAHMHGCMRAEIDFIISGWLLSGMQKPPLWASLGFSHVFLTCLIVLEDRAIFHFCMLGVGSRR